MSKPKIVIVAGTNASGKSALGVALAEKYNAEIISADSRQVFRGFDLGSGKITPEEMRGVRHHLIDVCDAGDFFSMHDFQRLAYEAIEDILSRGKLPMIVGGTGLYIASVADGYVMSDHEPDLAYRDELEKLETPELYRMLTEKIPNVSVDPKNRNRVMRMLEKLHDGDDALPGRNPRYDCLKLGVTWDRETLKRRIDERLERRMRDGMTDEIRNLLDRGASYEFMDKLGLEYRYITQYIHGEFSSEAEMCEQLSLAIKRFAKRQMTWFRREKDMHWLDMTGDPFAEACALIDDFLK